MVIGDGRWDAIGMKSGFNVPYVGLAYCFLFRCGSNRSVFSCWTAIRGLMPSIVIHVV